MQKLFANKETIITCNPPSQVVGSFDGRFFIVYFKIDQVDVVDMTIAVQSRRWEWR